MLIVQGDVFLIKIEKVKGQKVKPRDRGLVLAEGEATGHAHIAEGDCCLYEQDGTLYLSVGDGGATVKHEEHKPVSLPLGDFRVGIVKEWDAFEEEARQVRD